MKKLVWLLLVMVLGVGGYAMAGPYLTLQQIKVGVDEKDSEKLSANIDFPVLRQNLKDQLNAYMMRQAATELEDNPFGALAVTIVSQLVEGMVDSMITPAGLASLMEGKKPQQGGETAPAPAPDSGEAPDERDFFGNARYGFDSASEFSVWVPNDKGEELQFVLTRQNLTWKLSNIVIPLEN